MNATLLRSYFDRVRANLEPAWLADRILDTAARLEQLRERKGKVMFAGNGASASIASHFALDFGQHANLRAMAFNDAALLTALGNDLGYERWVVEVLARHGDAGDTLVLISSSGRSPNVVAAARAARAAGITVVAFTGFAADNPLRALGDVDFWVDSRTYNVVESVHATWLGALCDLLADRVRGQGASAD